MPSASRQLNNLPLSELIGGPLTAMVEAEALAAQTTVDYMEQVGFVPDAPPDGDGDGDGEASLGRLRMARFAYTKLDEEGRPSQFLVEVPLLSLVPIPGVRIKSGKVSFTARIIDIDPPEVPAAGSGPPTKGRPLKQFGRLRGGLSPRRTPSDPDARSRGSFEIDIQIEVEQMPIAPGLEKLLTTLDQAILDGQVIREDGDADG